MDDYLSWPAGSVRIGAHRYGPQRNWRVFAIICLPVNSGHRSVTHMVAPEHHVMDCFGTLVSIPTWKCQPERTEE